MLVLKVSEIVTLCGVPHGSDGVDENNCDNVRPSRQWCDTEGYIQAFQPKRICDVHRELAGRIIWQ